MHMGNMFLVRCKMLFNIQQLICNIVVFGWLLGDIVMMVMRSGKLAFVSVVVVFGSLVLGGTSTTRAASFGRF